MAYTTINKSTDYFNIKLYTGNGSARSITGVGFQPDWCWFKNRSTTNGHSIFDVIRGATKNIISNSNAAESTSSNGLTAFDSDGFSIGTDGDVNGNGNNIVAWNWKANGAGSANTDGATNTTVSVNTTAGFSIVKWTGTGSATTLGHGLGAVPKFWIIKNLDQVEDWRVYHNSLGNTKMLELNNTNTEASDISYWNNTSPTSSVMTVGSSNANNGSGRNMIAYCFAEKAGYSKFGSYEGNNNSDGTFIYTGFKPNFVITKNIDATADWILFDDARKTPAYNGNLANSYVYPSTNGAEGYNTTTGFDLLSNGFKMRNTFASANAANTYIYMAFGQTLVGSNNIPCTAR